MRLVTCVAVALLSCPAFARERALTPAAGFGGGTHGEGRLHLLFRKAQPYRVDSSGTLAPDGRFLLDQDVVFQGKPSRHRSWVIHETRPLRYSGSLSDAAGPVAGRAEGNRLVLEYRLKGPLHMHQTLTRSADGRSLDNVGRITLLGIPVGWLRETITRTGEATP